MLLYRILTFIIPIVVGGFAGLLFWRAQLTYFALIGASLAAFFGAWRLLNGKIKSKKERFFYSLLSLFQVLSGLIFFLFIENFIIKIILAALIVILNFVYFNELFFQYYKKPLAPSDRLAAVFYVSQIFVVFLSAASLYGLKDFLGVPFYVLLLIFFIIAVIISRYNNWPAWNIKINQNLYRIVLAIIVSQLFWAISLLSLVYYLKGVLMAIIYSVIISVLTWQLEKTSQSKLIRNYLIFALIIFILILATAQWF